MPTSDVSIAARFAVSLAVLGLMVGLKIFTLEISLGGQGGRGESVGLKHMARWKVQAWSPAVPKSHAGSSSWHMSLLAGRPVTPAGGTGPVSHSSPQLKLPRPPGLRLFTSVVQ